MRTLRSWLGLLGTLALAGLPAPAGAQPVGSEFQINTYTTSDQVTSRWPPRGRSGRERELRRRLARAMARTAAATGSSASATTARARRWGASSASTPTRPATKRTPPWRRTRAGTSSSSGTAMARTARLGIFGQRYDSAGGRPGERVPRQLVHDWTSSVPPSPPTRAGTSSSSGRAWTRTAADGIFGQRYDSAGVPLGGEFRVNSYTTRHQVDPSVASDASGNFVVVWQEHWPGRYAATGSSASATTARACAQGAEFRVNSYTTGSQGCPSVASDASGNFVVVWESYGQDGSQPGSSASATTAGAWLRGASSA